MMWLERKVVLLAGGQIARGSSAGVLEALLEVVLADMLAVDIVMEAVEEVRDVRRRGLNCL